MKFLFIIVLGIILFVGCSGDSDSNNPTGTSNQAPAIRNISADPVIVGRQERSNLTCVATDPDGDSLVYYWRATSGRLQDDFDDVEATEQWVAPNTDGNYWIAVTVSDGREVDEDSLELTVIAPNEPPATPWDPSPRDGSSDIDRPVNLTWKCSDVDGDQILYDLYFGTNSYSLIARDLDTTYYVLDNLNPDTRYIWYIVARDDHGHRSTNVDHWSFNTR